MGTNAAAGSTGPVEMKIRFANEEDAEAITRLVNAAFRVRESFVERERTDAPSIRALLQQGIFLLSEEDGKLAGCVYVEIKGERGFFGLLAVELTRQKSGLGSQLIMAAEQYARDQGCRFMDLRIVNLRSELPAYYQKRGYVETGTVPFPAEVPTKVPCHLVIMSKPLE
jgi:predicted N-acetyltransferase YhbS